MFPRHESFTLLKDIYNVFSNFQKEIEEIQKLQNINMWGQVSKSSKTSYKTYVLVIGESARVDYHHAYGYPISNTPFMSNSNGLLVNGLTSGGFNTISSLRLMLTKPDTTKWDANYGLNFVDLVNNSGFKTYWLSNQGFIGPYDTPISVIAKRSNYRYFLKHGSYDSQNTSDFDLLQKFYELVDSNIYQDKLIILHLYGSHGNSCDRIKDYNLVIDIDDKKYSYINCYISSIKKTDEFLERVYRKLDDNWNNKKEAFSMLYFSDHGVGYDDEHNGILYVHHCKHTIQNYSVPLFLISSDSKDKKQCKSFKSGLNFTNGIANWMGLENDLLSSEYSLFDCKDDPSDYGLSNKINMNWNDDIAIDIRNK